MTPYNGRLMKSIMQYLGIWLNNPKVAQFVGIIVSAVSTYYCGACSIGFNAAYDARLTYAATGDYNAAAKAGATTATISTAFYVVGAATSGKGITTGTKFFAHAMVGGVASVYKEVSLGMVLHLQV